MHTLLIDERKRINSFVLYLCMTGIYFKQSLYPLKREKKKWKESLLLTIDYISSRMFIRILDNSFLLSPEFLVVFLSKRGSFLLEVCQ